MKGIHDIIGDVVASMRADGDTAPYYMYGHRVEIAARLREKDDDAVYKYQKYPLIALRLPHSVDVVGNMHTYSLNVAIVDFTSKTYNSIERYENVITPILEPLYRSFLAACVENVDLMEMDTPEHTRIDRLFYGIEGNEGSERYIFDDPLDAIELTGLRLRVIQNLNCD